MGRLGASNYLFWFLLALNSLEVLPKHTAHTTVNNFCNHLIRKGYPCSNFYVKHLCTHCHHSLRCYQCATVDDPASCHHSVTCKSNEVCAVTQTITKATLHHHYMLNCIDSQKCSIFQANDHALNGTDAVHWNGGCCYHNNCNRNFSSISSPAKGFQCKDIDTAACGQLLTGDPSICSNQTIARHYCCQTCAAHVCQDTDSDVCQKLSGKVQQMCSDPCIAGLCRSTCKLCHGVNPMTTLPPTSHQYSSNTNAPSTQHSSNTNSPPIHQHSTSSSSPAVSAGLMTHSTQSTLTTSFSTTNQAQAKCNLTQPRNCPVDFESICGNCYFFSRQPDTWQDSQNICNALNGYLTELETEQEKSYLKHHLFTRYGYNRHYVYWLGGKRDQNNIANWLWQKASTTVNNIEWGQGGHPDTKSGTDCLEYGPMWDYKMNNADCSMLSHFICELM